MKNKGIICLMLFLIGFVSCGEKTVNPNQEDYQGATVRLTYRKGFTDDQKKERYEVVYPVLSRELQDKVIQLDSSIRNKTCQNTDTMDGDEHVGDYWFRLSFDDRSSYRDLVWKEKAQFFILQDFCYKDERLSENRFEYHYTSASDVDLSVFTELRELVQNTDSVSDSKLDPFSDSN